jgi:hypothetical protein
MNVEMIMKKILITLLTIVSLISYAEEKPGYLIDSSNGCKFYVADVTGREIKWRGNCINGYADDLGSGKLYKNGEYAADVKGKFKNGKPYFVELNMRNGDRYIGDVKEGKIEGNGIFYFNSDGNNKGDKYIGEFKNNAPNGKGKYIHARGDRYIGEFNTWKRNGMGIYYFYDGRVEEGVWENDKFISQLDVDINFIEKYIEEISKLDLDENLLVDKSKTTSND